ncbi:hypothetical protein ACVIGB_000534 [Bradyrhizobium sp. USDA 4341]
MNKTVTSYALALLIAVASALPAYPQGRSAIVTTQPLRTVQMQYQEVGPSSSEFKQLWPTQAREINPNPSSGLKPQAFVGHVREASGALLTVTMLAAAEECGPQLCPIRIFRDGKLIKEFSGCNSVTNHRVTADGKYLVACDAQVAIPPN